VLSRIARTLVRQLKGYNGDPESDLNEIRSLFDPEFYRETYGDTEGDDLALARHYLLEGWRVGRDPSPDFSTDFYIEVNADVAGAGMNPLLHYARFGKTENRAIAPSLRTAGRIAEASHAAHTTEDVASHEILTAARSGKEKTSWMSFMRRRHPDADKISSWFNHDFYRSSFPRGKAPEDLISHYLRVGWKEGRDPTPWFSTRHYLAIHQDVAAAAVNPFLHYCLTGSREHRALAPLGKAADELYRAHESALSPGPLFEEFDPRIGANRNARAKVLAYYLPQFHAVAVNDENWGRGFTEWRKLARGMPRFSGHIQPRLPRDLGYYDLSEGDAMRRQVELARAAGLHGFCFYHYWFDGERVLETPMERFLADPDIDFPFCLMWANENWTRTWDGADSEIILEQSYDEAQDEALIADLARHMLDGRYIRLGGRPLLFIYRPGHIPDAASAIRRWRSIFSDRYRMSPLIFMAQGFGDTDPGEYGLDGAIEFPPHKLTEDLAPINGELDWYDKAYRGHVFSYDALADRSLSEGPVDFPLIKTAAPSWDNEARRPGRGMLFHGSTPQKFEDWMSRLVSRAKANPVFGEPIVCVNAWNEWAEGAVLEPDVHHGAAYLNALSRAIHGISGVGEPAILKVLIVGHDANQNGAQNLALHIGRHLRHVFGVQVAFLLGGDGPLVPDYQEIGEVVVSSFLGEDVHDVIRRFRVEGYSVALTNTAASGLAVQVLKDAGFSVVSLIHELPGLLRSYNLAPAAAAIARLSDQVICPAQIVQEGFESFAGPILHGAEILPQGLYNTAMLDLREGHNDVRDELGLSRDTKIVLGVGYADLRKGIDRFVATGLAICSRTADCAFIWVGDPAREASSWYEPEIEASGLANRVRILGHRDDVERYFAAADVFYLSSREDPFPSVVLEALACGLPIVGHKGCGGCDTLIARHGALVDPSNPLAAASAILDALNTPVDGQTTAAQARQEEIASNYQFDDYAFNLLRRLVPGIASVSAVIPNHNYAAYIGDRLRSVFDQTHPLREVLVLDDASTDDSLDAIRRTAEAADRTIDLHVSGTNSGSPFRQWRRGVELAIGDYVWIAEADDLATPELVAQIVRQMDAAGSALGFCDSCQVDEADRPLGDSYRGYLNEIEPGAFDEAFDMEGEEFLARYLSVKNVILNVSAVLLRRDALLEALRSIGEELQSFRVAGDWRLYVELCSRGAQVSYLPYVLNSHRRHRSSVTHALKVETHLSEIARMHRIVAERVELDEAKLRKQSDHYEMCRRHLAKEV